MILEFCNMKKPAFLWNCFLNHTSPLVPRCPLESLPFPVIYSTKMVIVTPTNNQRNEHSSTHTHTNKGGKKKVKRQEKRRLNKATIFPLTARGTGLRKGLLVPSKLSYVAFQLQQKKYASQT